jgi:AmmeMemoRadiSam system protein A
VPEVGKGEEGKIGDTLNALEKTALEIAALAPETVIFITPHNVMYSDYFHISPGRGAKGDLSRFGAAGARFEAEYDAELAESISRAAGLAGIPAGTLGEKNAALDHAVTVPMRFINRFYSGYKAVRVSASGMGRAEHYRFGMCISKASESRRAVLVASGDLSHKLSGAAPYGFAPEGAEFDSIITEVFSSGDFSALFSVSEELRERAAECGYSPFMILAGAFDCLNVNAELRSYEAPFGVGYAVASFTPGPPDQSRRFLEQHEQASLAEALERKGVEDGYRALARRSLEHSVINGGTLPLPDGLDEELLSRRAGAFVTLYKDGRLRGCIGTIAPTEDSVALEIIRNAVSAGLHDNRFDRVEASELPFLTYKVDILAAPELIFGPDELDVRRYGVIVSNGGRRGLLLPNLDGVDTAEEQIAIARRKGGIAENEPVKLERFEVRRYE